MNKIFKIVLLPFILIASSSSCDDGDIILNEDISFDVSSLDFCTINDEDGNVQTTVFFNINSTTNEVLSFETNNTFIPTQESVAASEIRAVEQLNLSLRDFDSTITRDYFCSGIPDSSIQILSELTGDRGNIQIQTRNITTLDGDEDNDGLSNEAEGFFLPENVTALADGSIPVGTNLSIFRDTDSDGIPDFRDQDDDNDNVITAAELQLDSTTNTRVPMDTDGDSIPDHLDDDDDGDGIITRNEITETGPLPNSPENRNPDELPHYLNDQISDEIVADITITNIFRTTFRTSVIGLFVGLTDGSSTITRDILRFGEFDISETEESTPVTPEEEETP